jgi:hypothetical protein
MNTITVLDGHIHVRTHLSHGREGISHSAVTGLIAKASFYMSLTLFMGVTDFGLTVLSECIIVVCAIYTGSEFEPVVSSVMVVWSENLCNSGLATIW